MDVEVYELCYATPGLRYRDVGSGHFTRCYVKLGV
jgi:hypothetical protein